MKEVRVLEIKQSIFADNDREADKVRSELKEKKVFLLNLMSSPGSGKTTTLTRTIERLKDRLRIGIMEADIDSDVDARTIAELGVRTIQLHTGGMCHLDADMTHRCGEERHDPVGAGRPRQTLEVPADVLHLRRGADQQGGRAAVL